MATVTFPGPVFGEDKRAAFQYCDGFILPSLSEGLPMVLLEAWAYGKPVVMTPQCNLPEGYEAGAAVRIEPEEESIREGLTRFLGMDDGEREQMGAKGRELAARRFSWKVVAREMAEVYRWVAGQGAEAGDGEAAMKYRVAFLSVVPSPYQRDIFAALARREDVDLRVDYLEAAAPDSPWPEKPLPEYSQDSAGVLVSDRLGAVPCECAAAGLPGPRRGGAEYDDVRDGAVADAGGAARGSRGCSGGNGWQSGRRAGGMGCMAS